MLNGPGEEEARLMGDLGPTRSDGPARHRRTPKRSENHLFGRNMVIRRKGAAAIHVPMHDFMGVWVCV